jgi:FAD/FMN-containing dehydrogenase
VRTATTIPLTLLEKTSVTQTTDHDIDELLAGVHGIVLTPGEEGYEAEAATYNLATTHHPAVIVGAADADDVQAAVRFATRRGLPVAVMATGHGPVLPADGAVLITTHRMDAVRIDPVRRTARVEAGVVWQQVVDAAAEHGLAPLNGSSPLVGVVGYTLGGGLSPTMGRAHGWASDHIRSLEVVTADGRLRRLDASTTDADEQELFWALPGAKSNLGVVTALEFDLFPVQQLHAGGLFFAGEHAEAVLTAYAELTATAPAELSSSIAFLRFPPLPFLPEFLSGRFAVHVRFSLLGDAEEGARLLAPLRAAAPALLDTVTDMPYTGFAGIHADPTDPAPFAERNVLLSDLDAGTVRTLLDGIGTGADAPAHIVELRHMGGALSREPAPHAAGPRRAAFVLWVVVIGPHEATAPTKPWIDGFFAQLAPSTVPGKHLNFMDADDADPEQVRAAFPAAVYARLQQVKQVFDPQNTFRLNHNIAPHA